MLDGYEYGSWNSGLPVHQVVIGEGGDVTGAHRPSIDRATAEKAFDKSSVSAAKHSLAAVVQPIGESDAGREILLGRIAQPFGNAHFRGQDDGRVFEGFHELRVDVGKCSLIGDYDGPMEGLAIHGAGVVGIPVDYVVVLVLECRVILPAQPVS